MIENNFLRKKYPRIHVSEEVVSAKKRTENRENKRLPNNPNILIDNYLQRFVEILDRTDEDDRQRGIEALRTILHKNEIIKPEDIPDRVFELEKIFLTKSVLNLLMSAGMVQNVCL